VKAKKSTHSTPPDTVERKADSSAGRSQKLDFCELIRSRRAELALTQAEVASRIKTSSSYVGHLESGTRYPSTQTAARLAKALRLDLRELFFLLNTQREASIYKRPDAAAVSHSTWNQFRKDKYLRRIYSVSTAEVKLLSRAPSLNCAFTQIQSSRDLVYMLNMIREAVGK